MDCNRTQGRKTLTRHTLQLAAAVLLALALTACSKRPSGPDHPSNPPRPETAGGYVIKANFVLPARPVPPSPGWM